MEDSLAGSQGFELLMSAPVGMFLCSCVQMRLYVPAPRSAEAHSPRGLRDL